MVMSCVGHGHFWVNWLSCAVMGRSFVIHVGVSSGHVMGHVGVVWGHVKGLVRFMSGLCGVLLGLGRCPVVVLCGSCGVLVSGYKFGFIWVSCSVMWGHGGLFGGHVGVMWSTWGHAVGRGGCRVGVACGSRVGSRLGVVWCPLVSLGSFGSFVICVSFV